MATNRDSYRFLQVLSAEPGWRFLHTISYVNKDGKKVYAKVKHDIGAWVVVDAVGNDDDPIQILPCITHGDPPILWPVYPNSEESEASDILEPSAEWDDE